MENIHEINLEEEFSSEELKNFSNLPEAALTNLKHMIERIDNMSEKKVIIMLERFHLDAQGDVKTSKNLLKNSYKILALNSTNVCLSPDLPPYYVIIDFEATCEEVNSPNYRQEIIEFPAVIVESKKQRIVDCFQMYCKPEINPKLSNFCMELTGITQEQVDSAETFDKVLNHFQNWLAKHSIGKKFKCVIVTDGPWDMSRFLYSQCHFSNVAFPKWAQKWVNLKQAFSKFYKCKRICLKNMLKHLKMDFVGRPHCGLDDAKNIARILLRMIYDGANIQINERVTVSKKPKQFGKEMVNGNLKKSEPSDKMEKLKIETHFTRVHSSHKMLTFNQTKRQRSIAEVQLAREIFSKPTLKDLNNTKSEFSRKKSKES